MKRIALPFLFALTFTLPAAAYAQRRSPLADAPAIRKRVELRETRFEFGAGLASTVNQTFNHGVLADVRLGFHINDWLSISGLGAFNVASLSTGFHDELITSLPTMATNSGSDFRAPAKATADSSINKASMILAGQLELTPFTGKYAVFGALFAHYDFYVFGGAAGVNLVAAKSGGARTCSDTHDMGPCVVTGMKIGGTFGAGFHSFFNNFVALNVEVRDLLVKDNPAGRDVNGDLFADNKDLTWTSHLMASLGVTIFLPSTADISP